MTFEDFPLDFRVEDMIFLGEMRQQFVQHYRPAAVHIIELFCCLFFFNFVLSYSL